MNDCACVPDAPRPRRHQWARGFDTVHQDGGRVRYEPRRPEADGPLDVDLSDLPGVGPDALGLVRSVTVRGHRFVRAPERDWDGEDG